MKIESSESDSSTRKLHKPSDEYSAQLQVLVLPRVDIDPTISAQNSTSSAAAAQYLAV